jgi:hypothetical protein
VRVLVVFLLLGWTLAQDAKTSLCVMTQGVVSQPLAELIRKAVVERRVQVYILTPSRLVETPASYLPALSLIHGVAVRLVEHEENFVIQDGSAVFDTTFASLAVNPAELYDYFLDEWERANPYRFTVMIWEE